MSESRTGLKTWVVMKTNKDNLTPKQFTSSAQEAIEWHLHLSSSHMLTGHRDLELVADLPRHI